MGTVIAVAIILISMFAIIPALSVSGDISRYEDEQELKRMMREESRK